MKTSDVLTRYKRVAVVGISANPDRPSHWIAKYLIEQGYDVIGVNPGTPKIEGVRVVGTLAEAAPLEIVDVFRSPDAIPALVEELKGFKPPVLWLQPGAENPQAEATAKGYGMHVLSGPCIYQEHRRLE
jgi:predicted CoA-binding protein